MTVKSRLLEILEKQKGETLSGEKLAEELHCTRAAIWKAVKSLREEGYKQRIIDQTPLCLQIAPIHVNGISQRLKRIKRNSHRQ